jgi:plastocyanin
VRLSPLPATAILLAAALALAACGGGAGAAEPSAVPRGAVLMTSRNLFDPARATVEKGHALVFVSDSRYALHILVPGTNAQSASEPGAPSFGGHAGTRVQPMGSWTSPPWATVGVFPVTCTIHPAMNLTVRVVP